MRELLREGNKTGLVNVSNHLITEQKEFSREMAQLDDGFKTIMRFFRKRHVS